MIKSSYLLGINVSTISKEVSAIYKLSPYLITEVGPQTREKEEVERLNTPLV